MFGGIKTVQKDLAALVLVSEQSLSCYWTLRRNVAEESNIPVPVCLFSVTGVEA
jgi:hypothetical protein